MRDIFYPPENGTGGGHPDPAKAQYCTQCRGPMQIEIIPGNDHESWVCPNDATAWAVDQEWANDFDDD